MFLTCKLNVISNGLRMINKVMKKKDDFLCKIVSYVNFSSVYIL